MQCPACGSDTTPELPRCTRCNTPLIPGPPPPPGVGGDENVTSLSPEPWDFPEPEMWRPPAPAKRSPVPYILIGAGAVVLLAVALAIVFWPSSKEGQTPPANSPAQQGQVPGSQSESAGDTLSRLKGQAGQVDSLLIEMATTRADLGTAVTGGCQIAALEQIRTQRQDQLAKARSLEVDALENGTPMRDALVRALEASVESNQRYLDIAPGCPTDDEVRPINEKASQAKREFVGYWRPNAERAGLNVIDAEKI